MAHRDDARSDSPPVPGLDDEPDRGTALYELEVDGELFAVRARLGGTDYDWISGPNTSYGFSTTAPPDRSHDEHRQHIRGFLEMIDPATGYLADD